MCVCVSECERVPLSVSECVFVRVRGVSVSLCL